MNERIQCGHTSFSIPQLDAIGEALLYTDCGLAFGLRMSGIIPEEVDMKELERQLNARGYFHCSRCDEWGKVPVEAVLCQLKVDCGTCGHEIG